MKIDAVFVLVAFIALGMEMACVRGEGAEGILPASREDSEPSFQPGDGLAQKQTQCVCYRMEICH